MCRLECVIRDAENEAGAICPPAGTGSAAVAPAHHPSATAMDASATADEAQVWGIPGLPNDSPMLIVVRGPNAGSWFLLNRAVTFAGRHPDTDILLDDITVSRRHAEFRRDNNEIRVVDNGSLNGTYVNRQPVESAELAHGDQVQIGKFRLVFLTRPTNG
jgi:pSer/pThr/pTyr-binding forkhead associated (FHA) protein